MNKKGMMRIFFENISDKELMTLFIKILFNYENLHDYNYLFRIKEEKNKIIVDIYDNVSDNRFNRYIFDFNIGEYDMKVIEEGNVFVNYIYILNIKDPDNNLLKLAYLFRIRKNKMIEYAKTFLPNEIVQVLIDILKEPICK
ncbi:MAG: hypothetical protein IJZ79_04520 [Bacilli bacterium]|nr:hypothetical protein [Bacilli bacterium]